MPKAKWVKLKKFMCLNRLKSEESDFEFQPEPELWTEYFHREFHNLKQDSELKANVLSRIKVQLPLDLENNDKLATDLIEREYGPKIAEAVIGTEKDNTQDKLVNELGKLVDQMFECEAEEPKEDDVFKDVVMGVSIRQAMLDSSNGKPVTRVTLINRNGEKTNQESKSLHKNVFIPVQNLHQKLKFEIGSWVSDKISLFPDDQDDGYVLNISEIPFMSGKEVHFPTLSVMWKLNLQYEPTIKRHEDYEFLKKILFLRDPDLFCPIMNHLKLFFSQDDWNNASTNALIKVYFQGTHIMNETKIWESLQLVKDTKSLDVTTISAYQEYCLNIMAKFHIGELDHTVSNEIEEVAEFKIKQRIEIIAKSLLILYDNKKYDLMVDFLTVLQDYMSERLSKHVDEIDALNDINKLMVNDHQLVKSELSEKLPDWCTVFVGAYLNIVFPVIIKHFNQLKAKSTPSSFIKSTMDLFGSFRSLFEYVQDAHIAAKLVNSFNLYNIFEPYFTQNWVQVITEDAKLQIQDCIDLIRENFVTLKWGDSSSWTFDQSVINAVEARAFEAFRCSHNAWRDLDWPHEYEDFNFGAKLLVELENIFHKNYIKDLQNIIMENREFDHQELVFLLVNLQRTYGFIDIFNDTLGDINNKMEMKHSEHVFNLIQSARDRYYAECQSKINQFCEYTRSKISDFIKNGNIFEVKDDAETDNDKTITSALKDMVTNISSAFLRQQSLSDSRHLLGYVNGLLNFFSVNLDKVRSPFYIDQESEYFFKRCEMQLGDLLIDIVDQEMLNHVDDAKRERNIEVLERLQEALDKTIDFQRKVSLKKTYSLSQAKSELGLKRMKTSDMILRFLNDLDLRPDQSRGVIKFSASKQSNGEIKVMIRKVTNLIPRSGKPTLDFSLSISIQPNIKQRHRTNIIAKTTEHDFEAFAHEHNQLNRVYVFDNVNPDGILQIVLYDHSIYRTKKYFRGLFQLQVTDIKGCFDDVIEGVFSVYPCILTKNNPNLILWNELKTRENTDAVAAKFIKNGNRYMFESTKPDFRK